jgi:hypothetical protein
MLLQYMWPRVDVSSIQFPFKSARQMDNEKEKL